MSNHTGSPACSCALCNPWSAITAGGPGIKYTPTPVTYTPSFPVASGGAGGYASGGAVYSSGVNAVASGSGGGGGASGSSFGWAGGSSSSSRKSSAAPRMQGFDGKAEFDFAIGAVRGYRWWKINAPDLSKHWDDWKPDLLTGAQNVRWAAGLNTAKCNYYEDHLPPVEYDERNGTCGCGYWAYWSLSSHNMGAEMPVAGVMEGWGRTLIGEAGFRCEKAKIVALYLPWTLEPAPGFRAWHEAFAGNEHFRDKGQVLAVGAPPPADEEREQQIAREYGQAWMAVIQDKIQQLYPEAELFATKKAMLAKYPPIGAPGPHEIEQAQ